MKLRGLLTVADDYQNGLATCFARHINHTSHQSFAAELNQLFGLPETRRFARRQNYRRNLGLPWHVTALKVPPCRRVPKLHGSIFFFPAAIHLILLQTRAESRRRLTARFPPAFQLQDRGLRARRSP